MLWLSRCFCTASARANRGRDKCTGTSTASRDRPGATGHHRSSGAYKPVWLIWFCSATVDGNDNHDAFGEHRWMCGPAGISFGADSCGSNAAAEFGNSILAHHTSSCSVERCIGRSVPEWLITARSGFQCSWCSVKCYGASTFAEWLITASCGSQCSDPRARRIFSRQ